MPVGIAEAASAGERPGIDVATVFPLDEAHRLEDIARVRNEQMKFWIVRRSPKVDAARRTRRGNAVLVQGDWHERPAQFHIVVVDQMFAISLMLWLAFVEIVAGDRILRQRLGLYWERLSRRRL